MELDEWLAGTDALASLDAAYDAAWAATDTTLLSVCRRRMAMLLRHDATLAESTETELASVRDWPTSDAFTERERAALEFTEQYVIDVASLTDDQAGALRDHLGDEGFSTFVNALLVIEQRMSLELAFAGAL